MDVIDHAVMPHHEAAATMWGRGGKHYDDVSYAISDALAHAAQRLNARAGERILNIATGTGWSARNVARTGAAVTGVDISEELLAAARELSAHVRPPIDFRQADAERLPFGDGAFDGVTSTFGIMFAFRSSAGRRRAGARVPPRRSLDADNVGAGGGRGAILRGHRPTRRCTASPLFTVGLGRHGARGEIARQRLRSGV